MAAMAAGEAFPEDALRGLAAHWGCVRHEGAGWEPPPPGWHTLPDASFGAGAHIGGAPKKIELSARVRSYHCCQGLRQGSG